jgi:DNA-3-methyladenine glycosylase I
MRAKAELADLVRCPWSGIADPIYARYHDQEWGVPKADDRALFEKLVLEGFQAGLSWLTILKKRENFRHAFHDFEPERIARYGAKDIARLMADPGIVRNRLKVEATIDNARALLALQQRTSLAGFLWSFLDGRPQINRHTTFKTVPAETPVSKAISKALKAEGFRFVGPTTIYAFMQATGMVNDHLVGCHRHGPCAELQRRFTAPARVSGSGPSRLPSHRVAASRRGD